MISQIQKQLARMVIAWSHYLQKQSPLRNPALWDLGVSPDNHLTVDGLKAAELLEAFGSPLMVVNKRKLTVDARRMVAAMKDAPAGSRVLYSYKTNGIPGILQAIHDVGIGAEVISPYELWLAEKLGVPGDHIVYNGVNKTVDSLKRAMRLSVLAINIDHPEEIDRLLALRHLARKRVRVGLRLRLLGNSHLGLDLASGEAMRACQRIAAHPEVFELTDIHFNVISSARNNQVHLKCLKQTLAFILQIKQETGIAVPYINIGGGCGVPTIQTMSRAEYAVYRFFNALPKPPNPTDCQPIEAFLGELISEIRQFCTAHQLEPLKLIVEPGRFITSQAQLLLTRVNAVKPSAGDQPCYALTDTGKLSTTFPCDYEYHEMFLANRMNASLTNNYTIMGRICTPADWLAKNRLLPALQSGDVLAVMDAGAYFNSYSSNFAFPRPGVVSVADGKATELRAHESFEHLVSMDRVLTTENPSAELPVPQMAQIAQMK